MELLMRRFAIATTAALVFGVPTAQAASDENLELAFNDHCRECHSFVKDDNRLGPSLYGVVGRKAGTEPGYAYSQSLKGSGVTWDAATLDKWIADPDKLIPGNDMSPPYSGIADPAIRKRIVAFLKSISPHSDGATAK
jgi:cytochrome c